MLLLSFSFPIQLNSFRFYFHFKSFCSCSTIFKTHSKFTRHTKHSVYSYKGSRERKRKYMYALCLCHILPCIMCFVYSEKDYVRVRLQPYILCCCCCCCCWIRGKNVSVIRSASYAHITGKKRQSNSKLIYTHIYSVRENRRKRKRKRECNSWLKENEQTNSGQYIHTHTHIQNRFLTFFLALSNIQQIYINIRTEFQFASCGNGVFPNENTHNTQNWKRKKRRRRKLDLCMHKRAKNQRIRIAAATLQKWK